MDRDLLAVKVGEAESLGKRANFKEETDDHSAVMLVAS